MRMPLIDRADCLPVVADTQPGFFAHAKMTKDEHATAGGNG